MVVIDVFLFNDEFDMLEVRLRELNDHVDVFILVEAPYTFSGLQKPLYYLENKNRYSQYNIVNLTVDETKGYIRSAWDRETYCRNYAKQYIIDNFNADDLVILSDVDEVPDFRSFSLDDVKERLTAEKLMSFSMSFFYYNFSTRLPSVWGNAKFFRVAYLQFSTLQNIRMNHGDFAIDSGWHMSYFMPPEQIQNKLSSFSHQEYNNDNYNNSNFIKDCILNKVSLFSKGRIDCSWNGPYPQYYDLMPEYMKKSIW